jgi:release factor glutamine methyltransferase
MRRGVFIPRPETEILVEKIEALLSDGAARGGRAGSARRVVALDLCCGTGVIGISLANRVPPCYAVCVDVDHEAVALTTENAALNGVRDRVTTVESDAARFLHNARAEFDVIACNPPYVATAEIVGLLPEVKDHEPNLGLDGGPDGIRFYRELIPLLPGAAAPRGIVSFEIGDTQADAVATLLESAAFADVAVHKDYRGLDRVVIARNS